MLAKKPKGAVEKRKKTSSLSGFLWMLLGAILTLMIGVFLYLSPIFNFNPTDEAANANKQRQVQPKVETDTDNGDYEFYDVLPDQEMAAIPDETVSLEVIDNNNVPTTFEPDAVVIVPAEQATLDNANTSNNAGDNAANANTSSQDGDNQIVVVEENVTYEGEAADTDADSSSDNVNSNSGNRTTANRSGAAAIERVQPAKTYILQINSFSSADEADRRRAQVLMAGVDATVVKKTTANGQPLYQVVTGAMNNRQAVVIAQQRLQNNGIDSLIVEQRR